MPSVKPFSVKACEGLGSYVYLLIDPRDEKVFYVGKGRGNRCFAHFKDEGESTKVSFIKGLQKLGLEPRVEILKYGLTEPEALLVESTAIDLLDIKKLTNCVRGFGSRKGSRGPVSEIAATLDAEPVDVVDKCLLININQLYRPNMSVHELYDATRSAWKLGPKRQIAEFALSIYGGVVREVYQIVTWAPGGATMKTSNPDGRPQMRAGRHEFVGRVADDSVRRKYLGRSVSAYFKPGAQNPIQYVNC